MIGAIITAVIAATCFLWREHAHKQQMEFLASDFSERIQEYQRKLTILCTEPESESAAEVCLHIRLNKAAEDMMDKQEDNGSINMN